MEVKKIYSIRAESVDEDDYDDGFEEEIETHRTSPAIHKDKDKAQEREEEPAVVDSEEYKVKDQKKLVKALDEPQKEQTKTQGEAVMVKQTNAVSGL